MRHWHVMNKRRAREARRWQHWMNNYSRRAIELLERRVTRNYRRWVKGFIDASPEARERMREQLMIPALSVAELSGPRSAEDGRLIGSIGVIVAHNKLIYFDESAPFTSEDFEKMRRAIGPRKDG